MTPAILGLTIAALLAPTPGTAQESGPFWDPSDPRIGLEAGWPARAEVARAYLDQLVPSGGLPAEQAQSLSAELDRGDQGTLAAAISESRSRGAVAQSQDAVRFGLLADILSRLAGAER